jgi:GTPase Era involved in 16S rRNA processing
VATPPNHATFPQQVVTKPTTTERVEDVVLEMVETKVEEDLPHTTQVRMSVVEDHLKRYSEEIKLRQDSEVTVTSSLLL